MPVMGWGAAGGAQEGWRLDVCVLGLGGGWCSEFFRAVCPTSQGQSSW